MQQPINFIFKGLQYSLYECAEDSAPVEEHVDVSPTQRIDVYKEMMKFISERPDLERCCVNDSIVAATVHVSVEREVTREKKRNPSTNGNSIRRKILNEIMLSKTAQFEGIVLNNLTGFSDDFDIAKATFRGYGCRNDTCMIGGEEAGSSSARPSKEKKIDHSKDDLPADLFKEVMEEVERRK